MKLLIIILIILSIFLLSCSSNNSYNYNKYCIENRYMSFHDVNLLVNVTNHLIKIVNKCVEGENLTPLTDIRYMPEN